MFANLIDDLIKSAVLNISIFGLWSQPMCAVSMPPTPTNRLFRCRRKGIHCTFFSTKEAKKKRRQ